MKVYDMKPEHEALYFHCLEEWSDDMKESGNHKASWYEKMKNRGLGVKLVENDDGVIAGMIQYFPIEYSPAEGKDLYFIPCIWVHGHKQGRGNLQKRGLGKALLDAAEEDVKQRGAKGMVAWGLALPIWMKASWYKKQGYKKVENMKGAVLVWKPFTDDAEPPQWIKSGASPEKVPGKVTVTALVNGCCPVGAIAYERAKRAAEEIGDKVVFQGVNTSDRETFLKWGLTDALFLDEKRLGWGPPLSYEKIHKAINKKVRKLKSDN